MTKGKAKFYDEVVQLTVVKAISNIDEKNERLIIKGYNGADINHIYFLHVAEIFMPLIKTRICFSMPFFKWLFNKEYRRYRYVPRFRCKHMPTVGTMLENIVVENGYDWEIFDEVYTAYYM